MRILLIALLGLLSHAWAGNVALNAPTRYLEVSERALDHEGEQEMPGETRVLPRRSVDCSNQAFIRSFV